MAQIISSTGVTVELKSSEAVLLGKAVLEYVKQLYSHGLTDDEAQEVEIALEIMGKIGQIASSETQEIKGRLN